MKAEKPEVSKIEITFKDGVIDEFINDSNHPYFMVSKDGFFMISNYPLTIECNTCEGKGKTGVVKPIECTECKGVGEIDLYHKKK